MASYKTCTVQASQKRAFPASGNAQARACCNLVAQHERSVRRAALDLVGVGPFQNRLTALCMLANAADAVEVLSVALVLPTAGAEFRLSDSDKGLLTSAIFGCADERTGQRAPDFHRSAD